MRGRPPDRTFDGVDTWDLDPFDIEHDPTSTVTGPVVRIDGRSLGIKTVRELHDALAWILQQHAGGGS